MKILNLKFDRTEMKSALNYDPKNAQNFDNGVFWVKHISILSFLTFVLTECFARFRLLTLLWKQQSKRDPFLFAIFSRLITIRYADSTTSFT